MGERDRLDGLERDKSAAGHDRYSRNIDLKFRNLFRFLFPKPTTVVPPPLEI
jgi:hypothetical protein